MSATLMEILGNIQARVTSAAGYGCVLGQPRDIPTDNDTWIELLLDSAYELGESGGICDETLTVPVVTVTTVVGDPNGRITTLTTITARADAIKALIEADVTLGGMVQQATVKLIRRNSLPAAENAWSAGARIEIEVKQW